MTYADLTSYMHVYVHIYIYVHTYPSIYIYIYIYMYICFVYLIIYRKRETQDMNALHVDPRLGSAVPTAGGAGTTATSS